MKIRRWAGRGLAAAAVGGALIGLAGCGDSGKPTSTKPAAATSPSVQPADMVKSEAAATQYLRITSMQSFGAGCVNAAQCEAALHVLLPYASPLSEALHEEAADDPYYKGLVDLADKVSDGVQGTDPGDQAAMDAFLKNVEALKGQLQATGLGHI